MLVYRQNYLHSILRITLNFHIEIDAAVNKLNKGQNDWAPLESSHLHHTIHRLEQGRWGGNLHY